MHHVGHLARTYPAMSVPYHPMTGKNNRSSNGCISLLRDMIPFVKMSVKRAVLMSDPTSCTCTPCYPVIMLVHPVSIYLIQILEIRHINVGSLCISTGELCQLERRRHKCFTSLALSVDLSYILALGFNAG